MYDGANTPASEATERKPYMPDQTSVLIQRLRERIRRREEAGPPRPVRCCCGCGR
jgi:hypothetical protein